MKKLFMLFSALLITGMALAQKELAFPFQGGQPVMTQFFKDNFVPSADVKQHYAAGLVILKFTADQQGKLKKVVVYYADDMTLIQPVTDILQKSDRKWIIPDGEKKHDFIVTVSVSFAEPATGGAAVHKIFLDYYTKRTPLLATNQIPLDTATLLPTISLNYDATL